MIVAEVGINHNGSVRLAKEMIDIAVSAGVDVVKFQTANVEEVVTKKASLAPYQRSKQSPGTTQMDMLKQYHLRVEDFEELYNYCSNRILFASTAFDLNSLKVIESLNPAFIKVPSGEITNFPFLSAVGAIKRKTIVSTGMSSMEEIHDALSVIQEGGTPLSKITLLHCTSAYPAPIDDLNLRAIQTLSTTFSCQVGYSDHSPGMLAPIIAVSLGAKVIEKHFTTSRNLEGPDHAASLEPQELVEMVRLIRQTETALGYEKKAVTPSELPNLKIARRSIVASKRIIKGEKLSESNITTKRPADGLSPMLWRTIIGKFATKEYEKDDLIEE